MVKVDFATATAIDCHTHAEEPCYNHRDNGYVEFRAAMAPYFRSPAGAKGMLPTFQDTAAYYRGRNIAAVIFPVDAERETGIRRYSNERKSRKSVPRTMTSSSPLHLWISARARQRHARFAVWSNGSAFEASSSIRPRRGSTRMTARTAKEALEACAEKGVITLFHTGQTGVGSGMRSGTGMRLKYSIPMHLDDVALDSPDTPIVLVHPSFPWTDEGLAAALQEPNVYYEMSDLSPKYFPETFVRYANSILKRKMLFGSDWPAITPDRWLAGFENAPFKDEVRPLILTENALRLLSATG